jgi:hypothetical protein
MDEELKKLFTMEDIDSDSSNDEDFQLLEEDDDEENLLKDLELLPEEIDFIHQASEENINDLVTSNNNNPIYNYENGGGYSEEKEYLKYLMGTSKTNFYEGDDLEFSEDEEEEEEEEEFRKDMAVKIGTKEIQSLFNDKKKKGRPKLKNTNPNNPKQLKLLPKYTDEFLNNFKIELKKQFQQHFQLLVQTYLISYFKNNNDIYLNILSLIVFFL